MFPMVHVSSNQMQGQQFPTQGQQQFPVIPMIFHSPGMPPSNMNGVSPINLPMQMPLSFSNPQISQTSHASETSEGEKGNITKTNMPSHPQNAFQPIQMMNIGNPLIAQQQQRCQSVPNLVQPSYIPMIQVHNANGPVLQPVYYVPEVQKRFSSTEHHPLQQRSESSASSVGRSRSFDGSEVSDSGDPHRLHSNSNYSDCSNSRLGSDAFDSSFRSESWDEPSSSKTFPPGLGVSSYASSTEGLGMEKHNVSSGPIRKSSGKERKKSSDRSYCRRYYSDGKKRPTSKERQEELFKTELCNYWINGQKCRFGKRCIFAHGQHELRMPKRKIERNRLRPPFRKKVVSTLNKLNESNAESMISTLLCSAVEEIRNDKEKALIFTKALFNKAVNETKLVGCYSEVWRKLLNIHPMAQVFATQMQNLCLSEYSEPRHKEAGLGAMVFAAEMCKKKTLKSEETVHKILSDMFQEELSTEKNVELWCHLIESLKNSVDTNKYFPQLTAMKTRFAARMRFMIMDLEDLKKRNWVEM